ncbi:hypothetical protein [Sphaerisporangium sp. NPDC051011]|uniref:hypothetical protein n=1 Tax=Sphaerisporangium sp. NPDC051011 TaxID=3155792 RepID=UPI0033FAE7C7
MLGIPSLSVEYLKVPCSGPADLTGYTVEMAVLPDGQDPTSGDWKPASWIGSDAAVLIGPGTGLPLTKGVTYRPWVRITASPEKPVLKGDLVHAE